MDARVSIMVLILVSVTSMNAIAGTAAQSDWSGGEGIWGPVLDWGDEFYADTDVECYCDSSDLALRKSILPVPQAYVVDGDYIGGHSVCSSDVDGDGSSDVIGAAYWDSDITWWRNTDGYGTVWTEHVIDEEFGTPASVCSGDINGDGFPDVAAASRGDDEITWWENADGSGTSWTEHIIDSGFDGARSVHTADVNSDGFMDVVGAAENDDEITWWENTDGSGTSWIEHTIDTDFMVAVFVYSADVNGDGHMDVLGAAEADRDITWWENIDGTGTSWTEHTVDGNFIGAESVHAADVNGDGYMDVLGAAYSDNDITWWENQDGSGLSWTEHPLEIEFLGASSVSAADFNKDGCIDVLGAAQNANDVIWWENADGLGTSWIEHTVDGDLTIAIAICAADVNGDGYQDVIAASKSDRPFAWWNLTEYVSAGSLESSVLDVQEFPDWQTLDWNCTEPPGTGISFQVRASENSSSMGAWSDTLPSPCSLEGILADSADFIQYRAVLSTTDLLLSPILHDVTVEWCPYTGTHEDPGIGSTEFKLLGAVPNPALGHAAVSFSMPVDSWVELKVFDLAGRIVRQIDGEYNSGVHEVLFDGISSGVYLVRMTSSEFTATRRFVLMD